MAMSMPDTTGAGRSSAVVGGTWIEASPVGGQEIGLLPLAMALAITVIRLSARRRRRQRGRDTSAP